MKKPDRRALLEEAIKIVNSSLESHTNPLPKKRCCREAVGDMAFHTQTIREYTRLVEIITILYDS